MIVNPSGWVYLITTCVFLPGFAIWSATRPRKTVQTPSRVSYLVSVFTIQGTTLLLALSAASYNDIPLFPTPQFRIVNLVVAITFLVLALGTLPLRWAWKTYQEKQQLLKLLPHKTQDYWWWVSVALIAGIVEEIVYRGVMFTLWQRMLGSGWAIAICVLVFTLVHFVQGWRAMTAIGLIALAMHLIVLITANLYTAMIVHVLYDIGAGVVLLKLAQRDQMILVSP